MNGLIAVEKNLARLADFLENEGYEIVDLDESSLETVDAVVVSGADNNLMNFETALTDVPVIDAAGKSAADILAELQKL
ncbi:uncharacterized protein UPF0180 [Anaerospora hongkongensis]|jgi:hypothetical protein|uniref:Uncharacterized protein UPF0180 n=1 Tax=Anaerospora hongkongensis TaxID=244830 RepID=A0A4V6NG85_9FIRM|nr:YkuS family protein [Anaerospora hongkongensis]TCL34455.1 uncharacterized protein UPF0180 [Anaerospora hongkongensis]